jgi:hypothetical protein
MTRGNKLCVERETGQYFCVTWFEFPTCLKGVFLKLGDCLREKDEGSIVLASRFIRTDEGLDVETIHDTTRNANISSFYMIIFSVAQVVPKNRSKSEASFNIS